MIRIVHFPRSGRILPLTCFVAAMVLGCGESTTPPQLVPVTGKVTVGGSPAAGVTVIFNPRQGTPGQGAYGTTDSEGRFTLTDMSQNPGIQPGTYQVTFSKLVTKDGGPIPEGATAADVEAVETIPDAYRVPNPESTLNVVTVAADGGSFDFDIPKQ